MSAARTAYGMSTLAPIGLEELLAQGELQTRIDRKYTLTGADAAMVLDLVPHPARVLEIDGQRSFAYTSRYLDTDELTAFGLTAHRRRRRFKVRTRTYEGTGVTFLEVKTRHGAHTVKERLEGEHVVGGRLTTTGAEFVAEVLGRCGIDAAVVGRLSPALTTRYRRTTLFLPDSGSRVTVDDGLAWHDPRAGADLARPALTIIETKSPGQAGSMDRLLWSLGHRPRRISKYATGLAALHPDLPDNRWHRTLRDHF